MSEAMHENLLDAMRSEDAGRFAEQVEPYRNEIQVHCYRMLASYEDAQDLTQETFLKAWRRRETFEARASVRAWLYRIATNACLDFLERRPDRAEVPMTTDGPGEVLWLQPYPDAALPAVEPDGTEPATAAVGRETIELAFLVAVQHLPPRQRAALILRDVQGWSAKQTAALLDVSVPACNSALQRARETMRARLPDSRMDWRRPAAPTDEERDLVARYMDASDRADVQGLAALLHDEVRFAMPPTPGTWVGRERVVGSWIEGGFGEPDFRDFRTIATTVNLQPAVACYLKRPGDDTYRALAIDVLRIRDGLVDDITTFGSEVFEYLGLPETVPPN